MFVLSMFGLIILTACTWNLEKASWYGLTPGWLWVRRLSRFALGVLYCLWLLSAADVGREWGIGGSDKSDDPRAEVAAPLPY